MSLPVVLVVDDDPSLRRLLFEILSSEGFDIHVAENGAHALELIDHSVPDIILMDIQMPVMDGVTAARILKSDPRTQHIPIIAISAQIMSTDKCAYGMFSIVVSKPLDLSELIDQMNRLLSPDDCSGLPAPPV